MPDCVRPAGRQAGPPLTLTFPTTSSTAEGTPVRLMRSPDRVKDQTYFLSRLRQDQLSRAAFPIGEYTKQEVRRVIDSVGLVWCFVSLSSLFLFMMR